MFLLLHLALQVQKRVLAWYAIGLPGEETQQEHALVLVPERSCCHFIEFTHILALEPQRYLRKIDRILCNNEVSLSVTDFYYLD